MDRERTRVWVQEQKNTIIRLTVHHDEGKEIKRVSPYPCTMISAFARGGNGYVPAQRAYAQGGYETRLTSRMGLAPVAGQGMTNAALDS